MYFISCWVRMYRGGKGVNNNDQINKELDNKPSIFHKGPSQGLSVLACVLPKKGKGKAVNIRILFGQRLFSCSGILKLSMAEA